MVFKIYYCTYVFFKYLELVQNVTSCYLFDLCDLCGTNPVRGACLPATGLSKCKCFINTDDPTKPYTGDFCSPESGTVTLGSSSSPTSWTPIVVGVLSGLAGLFCAVTCCLLAVAGWRRRRRQPT